MTVKVDIKKAYDSVSWDFLLKILKGYGFSAVWISWISSILNTTRYSILINGLPKGLFNQNKELCVTYAATKIQPVLSHVFFTDDLLITCKASIFNARKLAAIFKSFETLTGRQVSEQKSSILFSRVVGRRLTLLRILKCSEEQFPIKYLGLHLCLYGLKKVNCQGLIDRIFSRITYWCTKLLSVAGRVELIRSTPIFLYWCSIYNVPTYVLNQLYKMCRDFLSGSTDNSKKIHLLSWDLITRAKNEGGLGLRKLVDIQSASKVVLAWIFSQTKTGYGFLGLGINTLLNLPIGMLFQRFLSR
ncbi:uncharacterized protein LOC132301645 [Cornus florida]|uniref:uncharacterized protein LOC132301645 n=1 Tax=Cornus florida TaxID=4283 RepID=UPI00289BCF27|nr:uncharacterized protein LOC132301645 [Cornus florida]